MVKADPMFGQSEVDVEGDWLVDPSGDSLLIPVQEQYRTHRLVPPFQAMFIPATTPQQHCSPSLTMASHNFSWVSTVNTS
jgi:hypothetical protein